jgi:hypothetical protein
MAARMANKRERPTHKVMRKIKIRKEEKIINIERKEKNEYRGSRDHHRFE